MYGWLGPWPYKEQGVCLQQIGRAIGNEFEDSQTNGFEDWRQNLNRTSENLRSRKYDQWS